MELEKYTERSKGFVQSAQNLALRSGHQRLTPEHLLKVLLDDKEGLCANLIRAAGGDPQPVLLAIDAELNKQPKVEGSGAGQVYLSPELARLFDQAESAPTAATSSTAAGHSGGGRRAIYTYTVTVRRKDAWVVEVPSDTVTVMVAVPTARGSGVTTSVRLAPDPPSTRLRVSLGTTRGLSELAVTLRNSQEVIAKGALLIVPDPVGFESVLPAGDAGAGPRVPVGSMIAEPADDVGWRV